MSKLIPRSELGQHYGNPVVRKFIRGKYYNKITSLANDLPYATRTSVSSNGGYFTTDPVMVLQKFPFWKFGGMPDIDNQAGYEDWGDRPVMHLVAPSGETLPGSFAGWNSTYGGAGSVWRKALRWASFYEPTILRELPFEIVVGREVSIDKYSYVNFSILGGSLYPHEGCNFVGVCHDVREVFLCAVEFSLGGAALIRGRSAVYSSYNDGGYDADYTDRDYVDDSDPLIRTYFHFSEALYPTIAISDKFGLAPQHQLLGVRQSNDVAEINKSLSPNVVEQFYSEPILFCDNNDINDISASELGRSGAGKFYYKNKFSCPDEGFFAGVNIGSNTSWYAPSINLKFYWPLNSLVFRKDVKTLTAAKFRNGFNGAPWGLYAVSSGKKIDITILVPAKKDLPQIVFAVWDTEATEQEMPRSEANRCDAVCMTLRGDVQDFWRGGAIRFGGMIDGEGNYPDNFGAGDYPVSSDWHQQVHLRADSSLEPGCYQFLFGALGEQDDQFHCAGDVLDILLIKTKSSKPRLVYLLYPARLGEVKCLVKMDCKLALRFSLGYDFQRVSGLLRVSAELSFIYKINVVAVIDLQIKCNIASERALVFNAGQVSGFDAEYFLFSRKMRGISEAEVGLNFAAKVVLSGNFECGAMFFIGKIQYFSMVEGNRITLTKGIYYGSQGVEINAFVALISGASWAARRPWFNFDSSVRSGSGFSRSMFAGVGDGESSGVDSYGIYIDRETGGIVGTPKVTGAFWSKYEDTHGGVYTLNYEIVEPEFVPDFQLRVERDIKPHFALNATIAVGTQFVKNLYISMLPKSECTGSIVLISNLQCDINGSINIYADVVCIKNIKGNFECIANVFTGISANVFWGFLGGVCQMLAGVSLANKIIFDDEFIAAAQAEVEFDVSYSNIRFYSLSLIDAEIESAKSAVLTVETEGYA